MATCWFRSILTELLGAAKEPADGNPRRPPSGPVKVALDQHTKNTAGVKVVNRVSTLMVWFPANWASKIASVRKTFLVSKTVIQSVLSEQQTEEDSRNRLRAACYEFAAAQHEKLQCVHMFESMRERSTQRMNPRANTFDSDSFKPLSARRDNTHTKKKRRMSVHVAVL